jgi:MFS family permease
VGVRGWLGGRSAKALVALSLVNLIDQVDTNILRGVLPLLEEDFDLTDLQLGMLGFAFVFVNAVATIPAGWVADRYRRTRIIGVTLLSWSGLSALAAAAQSFGQVFLARAALGIGQAVDDPASTSLLADHYPASLRGRVFSVQQVMFFLGSGLGIGLGGLVGSQFGWRWAFVLVGMPGSLIAFLVFALREPRRGEADGTDCEVQAAPDAGLGFRAFATEAARSLVSELRFIFGIRTMRLILVGVGTLLFTVSGVGFWLAVYHERYSGLTLEQATGVSALVLASAGLIGTLLGGSLADRVYGTGPAGRITLVSNAILLCAGLVLVSFLVSWVPVRLALQFLAVVSIASAFPGLRASMMDVVPAESRGVSTSAFALASTVFGTALAPPLVGLLSDVFGSLVAAFYVVMPPVLVGSLILRRAKDTIVADAEAIVSRMLETETEPAPATTP